MAPQFKFDQWLHLYAQRTAGMKSSAIRDLLSVTARPDIISLAGGLPYTRISPMNKIIEATRKVMHNEGGAALQYGPSEGHEGLKEYIVEMMKEERIYAEPEDILITDGAQQGLDLVSKIFLNPGDKIVVEAPSYTGGLNAFVSYQAQMVSIPVDNDGLRIDLLAKQLEEIKNTSGTASLPKFIYVIPNFHNPAGVTLSEERRLKLLAIAKKYGVLILEDNPYGRLRFEGESIKSLRAMDDSVIYLSTFSKIFAPGVRLGWVTAPRPILEKLIFGKQPADLCSSSFTQRVVEEYLRSNSWHEHLEVLIKIYRERRDVMLEALDEFFPEEAHWTKPQGGFFVWATLPEYIDTTEMLAEAISEKVAYVPGRAFFADGSGANCMRLAFCYPKKEAIYEGIKRLAKVIRRKMELYRAFQI
jgi:2-aminoadipate transaminase